jgi:DNA-binding LytR/AlgR family response regulator
MTQVPVVGDDGRLQRPLRALAVDDESPQLDELAYLLRGDRRIGAVQTATDATEALRVLRDGPVDVVFLDIRMPGLDGLELARILLRFGRPPALVFVTAHEGRAAEAFELGAIDYVVKPVRPERLAEAMRRVLIALGVQGVLPVAGESDEVISVELAGTTRILSRSQVRWVEAQGDYARLHATDGSHLFRAAIGVLEHRWADAGFIRIHRSYLVAVKLIAELRLTDSGYVVVVDHTELPVSRRHVRELKERLGRVNRAGGGVGGWAAVVPPPESAGPARR